MYMKIVVFDVGNASCNYICSPNKYAMMIDCGSSNDRKNPVDYILDWNKNICGSLRAKPYRTLLGKEYPLTLLHITHPDEDHVRNSERISRDLPPYLMRHTYSEKFDDADAIIDSYKDKLDAVYRGHNPESVDWGFEANVTFSIPIETVKSTPELKSKVRNNSSIIRYIKYQGVRFLFTGDLETAGWEWLARNNSDFADLMRQGIDVLIAPHHGHDSGFPKALFDLTGNVEVIILSKDSEATKDGTDVYTGYSKYSNGMNYYNYNDKCWYRGKVLSTRSNGNILMSVENNSLTIHTCKASSNHTRL